MARLRRAGDTLGPILKELGLEGRMALERIRDRWAGLMGGTIATHASPATLSKGHLTVRVSSHPWMHQLNFQRAVMLERLRPLGVTELSFMVGAVSSNQKTEEPAAKEVRPPRPLTQEESQFIHEALEPLAEDKELSALIASAIAKSLRKASAESEGDSKKA